MYKIIAYLLLANVLTHDIHLSKADIHYKSDLNALEYSIHVFIDDLEKAILEEYAIDSLYLFTEKEASISDSIIGVYLYDHLNIEVDGQRVKPFMLGKEMSEDLMGVYCYLEVEDLRACDNMEITNSIMLTTFDDQKNIINVKKDNARKAFHILDRKSNFKKIEL